MKKLIICLAKKYAVSAIKDAVAANKDTVARYAVGVGKWLGFARTVVTFLEKLAEKLYDGALTQAEADAVVSDCDKVVKSLGECTK